VSLRESFQVFWQARQRRERQALAAGAAGLGLLLVVGVGVLPALDGIGRLERGLPALRQRAATLDAALREARDLRNQPAVAGAPAGDLRAALSESLAGAGLHAEARPVPATAGSGAGGALAFREVPYARWSLWWAGAERSLGVRAREVRARAAGAPGLADIDLAWEPPRP
jgi:type II secretory pathway component PulM